MMRSKAVRRSFRRSRPLLLAGLCALTAVGPGLAWSQAATASRAPAASVVSTTEWPQFRAGPLHTGAVVDPVLTPTALSALSVTWRLGESGRMAVSGGLLYLAQRGQAQRGQVTAVRVADGSVAWRTVLPGFDFPVAPAVSDGVLVVAGLSFPGPRTVKGGVWGLDATTGRLLWQRQLPYGVFAAPTITRSSVLVSWVKGVSRLGLAHGGVMWTSDLPMSGSPATNGSILVGGDAQGEPPNDVHALDVTTGALRWLTPVPVDLFEQMNPVIGTGAVYTSTSTSLVAHGTRTGAQSWATPATGFSLVAQTDPPALAGNRLIEADGRQTLGVDTATGAVVWRADPGAHAGISANPVVVGGTAVVPVSADFSGRRQLVVLQMRDARTGRLTGTVDLLAALGSDTTSISEVVAAEGHLFVTVTTSGGTSSTVELSPS